MTIYSLIALFGYMSGMLHAFHISVCEINLDDQDQTLEISQRIFLDDLEEGLILWSGQTNIDLLEPKDKIVLDSLIENYITSNFKLSLDGKSKKVKYLGHQSRGDVMLVFIKVEKVRKMKRLTIENTVLMDLFVDQVNLIHVTKNGKLSSLKLDQNHPSDSLAWD